MGYLRFLLLAAMAAATSLLPGLISSLAPGNRDWAAIERMASVALDKGASPPEPAPLPEELSALLKDAGPRSEALDPQLMRLLGDYSRERGSAGGELRVPALEELLQSARSRGQAAASRAPGLQRLYLVWMRRYADARREAVLWLWTAAAVIPVLAFLFRLGAVLRWARGFALIGIRFSQVWLALLSLAAIGAAVSARTNVWAAMPPELLAPPLACVVLSAAALKTVDLNHPVANPVLKACAFPVLSAAIVAGARWAL